MKLVLFHAVQRVVREIPDKGDVHSLKLVREFGLIFREDNDQGEKRTLATPVKIKTNIQLLKERHASYLKSLSSEKFCKLQNELEKLEKHIDKGCLSGILPGHGTEANEHLHSLLNRSMLRGANTIGPQLAIAVLALIFAYSNKLCEPKHRCNSKIVPFKPIQHDTQKEQLAENGCANLFRNPTKLRQSDSSHGDTSSNAT